MNDSPDKYSSCNVGGLAIGDGAFIDAGTFAIINLNYFLSVQLIADIEFAYKKTFLNVCITVGF